MKNEKIYLDLAGLDEKMVMFNLCRTFPLNDILKASYSEVTNTLLVVTWDGLTVAEYIFFNVVNMRDCSYNFEERKIVDIL